MPTVGYATLQIVPSIRGISDEIRRQLVGPAASAGGDAGDAAGGGFKDKLKAGVAAAGVAAGALLVKGLKDAIGQANVTKTLQAQLGATGPEAAKLGKVAGKLYSSGVSGSFQDAADTIKSVVQAGLAPPGATNKQLQSIATKASDVANIFGQDMPAVTNAAAQAIRTGLAKNSSEAFDLITRGFQTGADKGGDFLDTINEYGTQFRKAGLDGTTAIGLINQAIKAGARDSDVAADAIKEFSIRAVDGSKTTQQGFKLLGLNATDMAAKFGKGGKSATAALDTTLDRLRGIKDPVKQAQAATALFGTQAEDLGKALFAMDPSKAAKGLGQVGGAADKAGKTIRSGPSQAITVFTRTLQQDLVNVVGTYLIPALTTMAGVAKSAFGWLKDNQAWVLPLATGLGVLAASIGVYVGATKVAALVTRGWAAAQGLFNTIMAANPIGLIIVGLVALGAALVVAYNKSATFRAIVQAAFSGIKTVALAVYNWFAGPFVSFFTTTIPNAFHTVLAWVSTNWPWILGALTGPIGLAVVWIVKHWDQVRAGFSAVWSAIKSTVLYPIRDFFTVTIPGWASSMKNRVVAFWQAELTGLQNIWGKIKSWVIYPIRDFFTKTIPGWGDTLRRRMVGAFDAARSGIKTAWDKIKEIARVPVAFIVNTVYNSGIRKVWNLVTDAFGGKHLDPLKFATGGVLPGYTPGRDVHLAALSGGEAIMRPEWTRAVGPGYVNQMNAAARSGGISGVQKALGLPGFKSGGIFGGIGSALSGAWDKIKKGASWLKDTFGGAIKAGVSHVVNPLINAIPGGNVGFVGILKSAVRGLVDRLIGAGKKGDELATPAFGGKIPTGQHLAVINAALRAAGIPPPGTLGQWQAGLNTLITRESGWNPKAINRWDSNAKAGHPSQGLAQTIPGTFNAYVPRSLRSRGILDPVANVAAAARYIVARYGNITRVQQANPNRPPAGYDSGGWLQPGVTAAVNKTGEPEAVLTASQWRAIQGAAAVGTAAASGPSTQYIINARTADFTVADLQRVQRVQEARARVGRPH
ncbi:phage tail tape measure protein [Streptomyces sp. MK7]|uniref:phage tail tape measure protein n=1 Tax=Streptomyces sp. MK7 TaxID=3067635 RepID=UPI0029302EC1|nr:phage tail tape measure protein [Streptomyces sp. MK7]